MLERERPAVERVLAMLEEGRQPADSDYLPARYNLDGTRHEDDWWNFQVDGYGTWLWALERHLARVSTGRPHGVRRGHRDRRPLPGRHRDRHLPGLVGGEPRPDPRDHARRRGRGDFGRRCGWARCRTHWPRRRWRSAERCVSLIRTEGVHDGHLVKWLGGTDVDASLLAVAALYDVLPLDDPLVTATVAAIEADLVDGGVHRYAADTFYGGGQWPVLAALLARHHTRVGNPDRAEELLDWVVSTADSDLLLPEQVSPLLAPDVLDEWLERWGSVGPPAALVARRVPGGSGWWCDCVSVGKPVCVERLFPRSWPDTTRKVGDEVDRSPDAAEVLDRAHEHALRWLATLPDRAVPPAASVADVVAALGSELPDVPTDPIAVVDLLAQAVEPGLTAMPSGRFFGFVIGGTHPAAMAADWLTSAWDQNAGLRTVTPGATAVDDIAEKWVLDLLGLPEGGAVGFVTGGTMANFTCLAAARDAVLARAGWDVGPTVSSARRGCGYWPVRSATTRSIWCCAISESVPPRSSR